MVYYDRACNILVNKVMQIKFFIIQASNVDFLCDHNFNFNKVGDYNYSDYTFGSLLCTL